MIISIGVFSVKTVSAIDSVAFTVIGVERDGISTSMRDKIFRLFFIEISFRKIKDVEHEKC